MREWVSVTKCAGRLRRVIKGVGGKGKAYAQLMLVFHVPRQHVITVNHNQCVKKWPNRLCLAVHMTLDPLNTDTPVPVGCELSTEEELHLSIVVGMHPSQQPLA